MKPSGKEVLIVNKIVVMESNPILKYLNDLSEITKKATNGALYQQMNLPYNERATDLVRKNGYNDYIVGDVLICKTGEVK